jgi:hypothetical protein
MHTTSGLEPMPKTTPGALVIKKAGIIACTNGSSRTKLFRMRLRDVYAFIEKIAGNGGARANEDEAVTLGRLVREAREIQARMGG